MKRRLSFSIAALAAISLVPCTAQAQHRQRGRLVLRDSANPSALIAAEIAFARRAQEKGQWTAFRETATDAAEMFTPRRVLARDWLKGRKDPPQAVRWDVHAVWTSCDGGSGITRGAWTGADGTAGWFSTIWQRQKDGKFKWVMDQGEELARPLSAPDWIDGKVADCPARRRGGEGVPGEDGGGQAPAPPRKVREDGPPRPLAGPLPVLEAAAGADSKDGQSRDGTLAWRTTVMPDGSRNYTAWMWKDGAMQSIMQESVPPARAPDAPSSATSPSAGR